MTPTKPDSVSEMPVEEALQKADLNASKYPDVPSVSRTLATRVRQLERELNEANAELYALSQDDGKVERALERAQSEIDSLREQLQSAINETIEQIAIKVEIGKLNQQCPLGPMYAAGWNKATEYFPAIIRALKDKP